MMATQRGNIGKCRNQCWYSSVSYSMARQSGRLLSRLVLRTAIRCRSKNVHGIKTLVSFQAISGCTFGNKLRLLCISAFEQKPASAIKKSGDDCQTSRDGIALDIPWALLAGV